MGNIVLQNFIVTKPERLETLKETFPPFSKYFKGNNFYVNYNTNINFDEVYSIYQNNIAEENLNFYNNLTKDWGKIVQSMLSDIDENYVFIIPEDFKIVTEDSSHFNNLLNEFIEYECDYMLMHRIEDVKNYGSNPKYLSLYDSKEYLHIVNSSKYPGSCLSSVAMYKKEFLNEFLTMYNTSIKSGIFPLALPNCYEWFSHGSKVLYSLVGDRKFAIPKKAVVQHYEPKGLKQRK